jgi:hypothetical protein
MIVGDKLIFEVGDPVVDQYDAQRRIGIIVAIEGDDDDRTLVVGAEGNPQETWRIPDANAVLP